MKERKGEGKASGRIDRLRASNNLKKESGLKKGRKEGREREEGASI